MVRFDKESGTYECMICHLHYKDKRLAVKCEAWDKKYNSCNLSVAWQSIEAVKNMSKKNRK